MAHGVQEARSARLDGHPFDGVHHPSQARLTTADLDDLARRLAPDDRSFRYRVVSKASYARRKAAANGSGVGLLSAAESERVERIAFLWRFAMELWKDETDARRFLFAPHMLMDYQKPIDLALASESGARRVENMIGRAMYGTYS